MSFARNLLVGDPGSLANRKCGFGFGAMFYGYGVRSVALQGHTSDGCRKTVDSTRGRGRAEEE